MSCDRSKLFLVALVTAFFQGHVFQIVNQFSVLNQKSLRTKFYIVFITFKLALSIDFEHFWKSGNQEIRKFKMTDSRRRLFRINGSSSMARYEIVIFCYRNSFHCHSIC